MPPELIGDDGLPITEVGPWTEEKHERLVKYVQISRKTRAKYPDKTSYIELFCGPGRSVIRGTKEVIEGSPLRAAGATKDDGEPYADVYLADADAEFVKAVCKRMPADLGRIHPYVGGADRTVDQIVSRLNPYGLHFAFLDPYKLDLPFSVIERLASVKRMDMLIHVSIHDFQRNLQRYMAKEDGPLDRFAPGWRQVVNAHGTSDRNIRIAIFNYWLGLIGKLDTAASEGDRIVKVVGSKSQPLYWLVFVARHKLAHEFWNAIRNVGEQDQLKL